ncbi:hypothetical protein [Paenibacillus riograndensis]|uniref:Putative membrane protein n=1 Tax=Paenibacillus riograndensis SBR5 TaxID=1073571 RepID=A0A0E4HBD0_9BACL|nr:hypothetical protein [Paenibacillus riograndensis]CQR55925.1 putative membrane protein [Paenibacillus riograndensis SBR5]
MSREVPVQNGVTAATDSIALLKKLPINTLANNVGLAIVKLPAARLKNLMPVTDDGRTVILDNQGNPLIQLEGYSTGGLQNVVDFLQLETELNGKFALHLDDVLTGVTYRKSSYNGWTYLSVVSINDITREVKAIRWYTVYISIGIFAFMIVF